MTTRKLIFGLFTALCSTHVLAANITPLNINAIKSQAIPAFCQQLGASDMPISAANCAQSTPAMVDTCYSHIQPITKELQRHHMMNQYPTVVEAFNLCIAGETMQQNNGLSMSDFHSINDQWSKIIKDLHHY